MKKTLTLYDFHNEWNSWEERKNTFSYEGKIALFEYLENYEEETGEEIELDIIALCCDYTEYDSLEKLKENYKDIETMEDVENNTQVIYIKNIDGTQSERFIAQNY